MSQTGNTKRNAPAPPPSESKSICVKLFKPCKNILSSQITFNCMQGFWAHFIFAMMFVHADLSQIRLNFLLTGISEV